MSDNKQNYENRKRSGVSGSITPYLSDLKNNLKKRFKKYVGTGIVLVAIGAGLVFLNATLGAFVGALFGEILDHIPYLNTAISDTLNTMFHTNYFTGNLDKVGATLGFVAGFFKGYNIQLKYKI
ncbi:MAG: hypothetical protein LM587_00030 [Candidatus Aenigmarchaeota archaeon]|nr:hypothetical protein [Candidatus Aenigmarchaeota archaeon]